MMVKEPDCLSLAYITAYTTTSSGRTALLDFIFTNVKSFNIKWDIFKTFFVFTHRTERYLSWILKTYPTAQILPPLSAILSPEDGEIALPALILK